MLPPDISLLAKNEDEAEGDEDTRKELELESKRKAHPIFQPSPCRPDLLFSWSSPGPSA